MTNNNPRVTPTDKAPAIEELLQAVTGKERRHTITSGECMTCNTPDMQFRTPVDRQEYAISGMCQTCQDKAFRDLEGED